MKTGVTFKIPNVVFNALSDNKFYTLMVILENFILIFYIENKAPHHLNATLTQKQYATSPENSPKKYKTDN